MNETSSSAEERYSRILSEFRGRSGVSITAPRKRGLGSTALCVNDHLFAMLTSNKQFVVNLPTHRVAELILAGRGEHFELGHGKPMRGWFVVGVGLENEWLSLAEEAWVFVGSTPA